MMNPGVVFSLVLGTLLVAYVTSQGTSFCSVVFGGRCEEVHACPLLSPAGTSPFLCLGRGVCCLQANGWSQWLPWSACSGTCGPGTRRRTRSCQSGVRVCLGAGHESEVCQNQPCVTYYCPRGAAPATATRIINGNPQTDCLTYPGVVAIRIPETGLTVCTGIITDVRTLTMPNNCAQLIAGGPLEIVSPVDGRLLETIPPMNGASIPTGGAYTHTLSYSVDPNTCPGVACVYNSAMSNAIDLNSCVAVGAGHQDAAATRPGVLSTLNIPRLEPTMDCPAYIRDSAGYILFNMTSSLVYNCFFSASGQSLCIGDPGAAIVCPLASREQVVIGQAENTPCETGRLTGFYNLVDSQMHRARDVGVRILRQTQR